MGNINLYGSKQKIIDNFNNNSVCLPSKSNVDCLREIKQICEEHSRYVHRYIKKDSAETKHLYDFVIQQTAFMDDFQFVPKFCTRLYWIVNDLKDFPRCHHCGKKLDSRNIYSFEEGYSYFCSYKCEKEATVDELKDYYESYNASDLEKLNSKSKDELKEELLCFIKTHREYSNILKRPNSDFHYLYKFVIDNTKFLDDFYNFKTRVLFVLNDWKEERKCNACGNIIKKNMRSIYEKFPEYCSAKCTHCEEVSKKRKETLKKHYGYNVKYPYDVKEILDKCVKSRKEYFISKKQQKYVDYQNSLEPYQRDGAVYWKLTDEQKQKFRTELQELINDNPRGYAISILKNGGSKHYLYDLIIQCTSPILSDPFYTLSTKVCFAINGWIEFPKCRQCGKRLDHKNLSAWDRGFPRFCSASCSTINDETKKKFTKTLIERFGVDNPQKSNDIKEKTYKTNIERYGYRIPYQNREIFVKTSNPHNYDYDGKHFDSSWELCFYIWLKDNNIDFEYQPNIKFEYEYNGKLHRYFPDFRVGDEIIEIKGDQFFDNNGNLINPFDPSLNEQTHQKQLCMEQNKVVIYRKENVDKYISYVENAYGKNFIKQFKNIING
jgi:hypothetical protein